METLKVRAGDWGSSHRRSALCLLLPCFKDIAQFMLGLPSCNPCVCCCWPCWPNVPPWLQLAAKDDGSWRERYRAVAQARQQQGDDAEAAAAAAAVPLEPSEVALAAAGSGSPAVISLFAAAEDEAAKERVNLWLAGELLLLLLLLLLMMMMMMMPACAAAVLSL
jgi:hypothetical protein